MHLAINFRRRRVAVEKVANERAIDEQRVLRESAILPQIVQVSAINVRDCGLAARRRRAHNGFGTQIGEKLPQCGSRTLDAVS